MSDELLNEDRLVQRTTADYFKDVLGWRSAYAYDREILGVADGTLGRATERDVVLTRYLRKALVSLNPGLPDSAYDEAVRLIVATTTLKSSVEVNRDKYRYYKDGVPVDVRKSDGTVEPRKLRVFDFNDPTNNDFLVVRELWVRGTLYRKRPDIVGFVNGIPLLFVELKNIHKNVKRAYDQNYTDYWDTIPHLFDHNAIVLLSNGHEAKVGTITSRYEHFHEWKRLAEDDPGVVDLETVLKGMFTKSAFMDIFENFLLFDASTGKTRKILARNHQYLGVNRAVDAVRGRPDRDGKLGVFWHTQGSGKSYSMVFFSEKVRRKLEGNFTFLVVTDREDLERQIYKTYVGVGAVNPKEKCRAASGENLRTLFVEDHAYVFSLIHKFNKPVTPETAYTQRDDVIVISDEAHRTQYGNLAINMRAALPRASYIGFTGTPLFSDDEKTKRIFGDYISTYDFQRAVDDNATVPLYYDNRGDKLKLVVQNIDDKIAQALEDAAADSEEERKVRAILGNGYKLLTARERLDPLARDFVWHYTRQWESGKAMLVCLDKITAVRMYDLVMQHWQDRIKEVEQSIKTAPDDQEQNKRELQLAWLKETEVAVVISEEQNEVKLFRDYGLDIIPHRTKIKNGYETPDGQRVDIDDAFKDPEHPFRVAIVCAMWLTGFDVPSLATLYLDKPLTAHTLMQAIARANRVYEGKENGLIVDYVGILKPLRQALATFASRPETGSDVRTVDPLRPSSERIPALANAIEETRTYLSQSGFDLDDIITATGFARNAAILRGKEAVSENDESRMRYELLAEAVFRKYKACINEPELPQYQPAHAAIDIVYKSLQEDVMEPDVTRIMAKLQPIIDDSVKVAAPDPDAQPGKVYDISKIDFNRLREEFKKRDAKRSEVQELKAAIDRRLQQMIFANPGRLDYQRRYQEIVDEYNKEKDRPQIEETFEELLKFLASLDDEGQRGAREGLSEEHLAIFDILVAGKELTKADRERVKQVSRELLDALKAKQLATPLWTEVDAVKAAVRVFIGETLYSDAIGLPSPYGDAEITARADSVYAFIFTRYGSQRPAVNM